jgi:arginase family enzyme
MRIELLHLDEGLTHQEAFLAAAENAGAYALDLRDAGRQVRLWGMDSQLGSVKSQLSTSSEPILTFMGSGDFHHVTALLLERLVEASAEPFTIIHFDNHPDWVRFSGGMHCGSWVNRALAIPSVSKIVTLGVCSHDLRFPECKGANLNAMREGKLELFPYAHAPSHVWNHYGEGAGFMQQGRLIHWRNMASQDDKAFLEFLQSRVTTENIYITVDKDVLDVKDVVTNWDQGQMRLPQLTAIIQALGSKYHIIGADVIGDYSAPDYAGSGFTRLKKRAEIYLDQPRQRPDLKQTAAKNAVSNLALLKAFQEVMA